MRPSCVMIGTELNLVLSGLVRKAADGEAVQLCYGFAPFAFACGELRGELGGDGTGDVQGLGLRDDKRGKVF